MKPYYDEDGITIYHGRCEDVIPSLAQVDLVVTSPPYNLAGSTGSDFNVLRNGYGQHEDAMGHAEYRTWQQTVLSMCWERLADDGAIFYNHKPRPNLVDGLKLPLELVPSHIPIRQIITWDRTAGHIHVRSMFTPSYEWVLLLAKPGFRLSDIAPRDVWRIPFDTHNPHPAPFPVELPRYCIVTTTANTVLDPFMGSGTTLRAAKDLGRRAIGIEIEERYCELAVQRLAQGVLNFTD